MAWNYAATRARADAHIRKFGRDAILRRAAGDRACVCLLANFTVAEQRANGLIQYGDQHAFITPIGLSLPPDLEEDKLVLDGVVWNMIAPPRPVDPSGRLVLYWDCWVRR